MSKKKTKIPMPTPNEYEWWLEGYRTGNLEEIQEIIDLLGRLNPNLAVYPRNVEEVIKFLKIYLSDVRKSFVKAGLKSRNRLNYFYIYEELVHYWHQEGI